MKIFLLSGENKYNKDGFYINLNSILKRIRSCAAVDGWFGQIPGAFK